MTAHRAAERAIDLAAGHLEVGAEAVWVDTVAIGGFPSDLLERFSGFWCVPATPYRSEAGALAAVRFAREHRRPFLGTCGGFQHALLEYGRNVLGLAGAGHLENDRGAEMPLISPLSCSLVERSDDIRLVPGTRLHELYGRDAASEEYHCSYGLNPEYEGRFEGSGLRFCARDAQGEVRAFELDDHPFFLGTLFQPERAALRGEIPPVVLGLVRAVLADE